MVRISRAVNPGPADVYVKLEEFNPGGSIKSRVALAMVQDAERRGQLEPGSGQTIIEATGGNTGVGLCLVAAVKGYKVKLVVPDNFSREKISVLQAYGADVVLSDSSTGNDSHFRLVTAMMARGCEYVWLNQFTNPANAAAHYEGTGEEIVAAFTRVDAFVAGVGSGGTITGAGRRLKEAWPTCRIYAVQPEGCDVLRGSAIPHRIQALALGFVPAVFDTSVVDSVESIAYETATRTMKQLSRHDGLFVGVSSGANLSAALHVAGTMQEGDVVVTVAPDSGRSYVASFTEAGCVVPGNAILNQI